MDKSELKELKAEIAEKKKLIAELRKENEHKANLRFAKKELFKLKHEKGLKVYRGVKSGFATGFRKTGAALGDLQDSLRKQRIANLNKARAVKYGNSNLNLKGLTKKQRKLIRRQNRQQYQPQQYIPLRQASPPGKPTMRDIDIALMDHARNPFG